VTHLDKATDVHNGTWGMALSDDGSLDTVVKCDACQAEYRYTYDFGYGLYDDFIGWALDDASEVHQTDLEEGV
jgi:hypothetical protein